MIGKSALAITFILVFSTVAAAQQVVRVRGNRAPLRAEPTQTSTALAYCQMGTTLEALAVVDGWYRVRDPQTKVEGFILATLVEVVSGSVPGQTQPRMARRPARKAPSKPEARLVLDVAGVWMTASESFKAAADTNRRIQFGGGVQVINAWKGLFVEATVGRSTLDGSRVFVYEGTVYDLGIPLTITFTPIDVGGGWRFRHGRRVHSYAGGGMTFMKYQEESDFADAEDNVSEWFTGFYVAGGIEFLVTKWVHLRGEVQYTSLPNALGAGGVSVDFGEKNLGGIGVAVKVAVGR